MKASLLFAVLLALPIVTSAKSETARIEIARGKSSMVTLAGAEQAGQFTIWSGPGTSMTSGDGAPVTPTGPRDFADWAAGPVKPPRKLEVYSVRFYCAAAGETPNESVPSHQCYGVRYAYGPGARGYIQIPAADDPEFPLNRQSIYRGVEGKWFHASEAWERAVRDLLDSARDAELRAQRDNDDYRVTQPVYVETRPSPRVINATPKVTPKPR